jgi:hypothetical protein
MAEYSPSPRNTDDENGLTAGLERVAWINQCLRDARAHTAQWRQATREAYDFRAGKQWSQEDVARMEEQGKVPIVFNRIERTVRAVVGMEIQNRQEVRFMPRGVEDTGLNEVYSAAADWVRDNCDAEDEESEAFQDLVTCGMGWTCTDLDYEDDPDGKVCIDRCDPLDMFWDASARKKNVRDARWVAHVKRVTREDILELWPRYADYSPSGEVQTFLDDEDSPHDATPPGYDDKDKRTGRPKTHELICFEWWEREPFHRVQTSDGQIIELSEVKWQALAPHVMGMGLQHVEQKRRVYYKAYVATGVLLEEKKLGVQKSGFTYKCMTGCRDRNANTFFGLVNLMADPQRFANKWLSQITHILNKSAKGGIIAEMDAFANPKQAQETWAKAENITFANPGALAAGKIQPKPETPFPDGYGNLLEFAIQSINDVPGVSVEMLGLTGRDQPGVLEDMRKKAGVTILAQFFDSIRLYRKDQGRLLVEYIRTYLSDGRLIRIVGEDGAKHVPLVRDPRALEFDVIVDESPTSPNNKERTFAMLTALAPTLAQAGVPLPPAILEFSPLPSALVEKWKEHIKENQQIPEPLKALIGELQATNQAQKAELGKQAEKILKMEVDNSLELYKVNAQREVDVDTARLKAATESDKRVVEVYEANLKAIIDRMDMVTAQFAATAKAHAENQPRTVVTEQAGEHLSQALLPALAKLMELTQLQMDQFNQFPGAINSLGDRLVGAFSDRIAGSRVVSAERVMGPNGRAVALRRKFANGDEDELPLGMGNPTTLQ